MSYKDCSRRSIICFSIRQAPEALSLKTFNKQSINKNFVLWNSKQIHDIKSFHKNMIPSIIIAKNLNMQISQAERLQIMNEVCIIFSNRYGSNDFSNYPFIYRFHIFRIELVSNSLNGFSVNRKNSLKLNKELSRAQKELDRQIKQLDYTLGNDSNPETQNFELFGNEKKQLKSFKASMNIWTIQNFRIKKLLMRIQLLKIIEELVSVQGFKILSVRDLFIHIQNNFDTQPFSESTLYRMLKMLGYKYKSITARPHENSKVKLSRIHFFRNFLNLIKQDYYDVFFFDWTTFCEGNFKKGMVEVWREIYC